MLRRSDYESIAAALAASRSGALVHGDDKASRKIEKTALALAQTLDNESWPGDDVFDAPRFMLRVHEARTPDSLPTQIRHQLANRWDSGTIMLRRSDYESIAAALAASRSGALVHGDDKASRKIEKTALALAETLYKDDIAFDAPRFILRVYEARTPDSLPTQIRRRLEQAFGRSKPRPDGEWLREPYPDEPDIITGRYREHPERLAARYAQDRRWHLARGDDVGVSEIEAYAFTSAHEFSIGNVDFDPVSFMMSVCEARAAHALPEWIRYELEQSYGTNKPRHERRAPAEPQPRTGHLYGGVAHPAHLSAMAFPGSSSPADIPGPPGNIQTAGGANAFAGNPHGQAPQASRPASRH